jgi:glucosylceramidase
VRQGARRIASTSGYDQLDTVAFHNADDGSLALLVVNSAKAPRQFAVRIGQRSFDYTLPAASVATFTWK